MLCSGVVFSRSVFIGAIKHLLISAKIEYTNTLIFFAIIKVLEFGDDRDNMPAM